MNHASIKPKKVSTMYEFSQGKYKQKAFNFCIAGMGGEIVILFVY